MATTLGISTQNGWTGAPSWPGQWHEITDVRFSHRFGGGPGSLTCRVVVGSGEKPRGLVAGNIIRLWRGMENVWTGIISQPDTGGDGIGITADGIGSAYTTRWVSAVGDNALFIDNQINGAITRGLPFTYPANAPQPYWGMLIPGTTLKDALDEITKQTGYEWVVSPSGVLTWVALPTACTYLLWAWGQGGARTLDNFGTDFYATYMPVEDFQLDDVDGAATVTVPPGTTWVLVNDAHHTGESSVMTMGASKFQRVFRDASGVAQLVDLSGCGSLSFWTAQVTATAVARSYKITLYDNPGVQWTLPMVDTTVPAHGVWTKSSAALTGMPAGFLLDQVRGYFFDTSAGVYFDDLWAVSKVKKNAFGAFPPQLTVDQANTSARTRYGRYEVDVDLTGQGQLSDAQATAAAQKARDQYSYRIRWTQPFSATKNSLTTMTGRPVDLATVTAGCRVRVLLADLNDAEIGTTGDAVEFVVGETDYDEANETLSLSPMDLVRKDLISLLGTLPKRRGG